MSGAIEISFSCMNRQVGVRSHDEKMTVATHQKFFLDLISVPVRAVSPLLGNDEGTLKQKNPSLLEQRFGPFLEGKHILQEQGVTLTRYEICPSLSETFQQVI